MEEFECEKCGDECEVERLDPKCWVAWCETCNDYATGFDGILEASEHAAGMADYMYDAWKERELDISSRDK